MPSLVRIYFMLYRLQLVEKPNVHVQAYSDWMSWSCPENKGYLCGIVYFAIIHCKTIWCNGRLCKVAIDHCADYAWTTQIIYTLNFVQMAIALSLLDVLFWNHTYKLPIQLCVNGSCNSWSHEDMIDAGDTHELRTTSHDHIHVQHSCVVVSSRASWRALIAFTMVNAIDS